MADRRALALSAFVFISSALVSVALHLPHVWRGAAVVAAVAYVVHRALSRMTGLGRTDD